MIFGVVPIGKASGSVLAHAIQGEGFALSKGRKLTDDDVTALAEAGHRSVLVARLEPGDVPENEAASALATCLAGAGVSVAPAATGRVNLHATRAGLALIDAARVHQINAVDEAITIATVAPYAVLRPGQMLATIKIIPFSAPASALQACQAIAADRSPPLGVAPFLPHRAGLVQTRLPGTKASVLDKTVAVTRARLESLGSALAETAIVDHDSSAVATEMERHHKLGLDPILIAGASATADRRDIIASAVTALGGEIIRYGTPVDPGNLLLLARIRETKVVVLPGCARSPKPNGFDWVLQRLLARLDITNSDIAAMGVGGLLTEASRKPREQRTRVEASASARPAVAGVLLAAGRGTRMGSSNKLLMDVGGRPLVVVAVEQAIGSQLDCVVVVVGHQADQVRAALAGMPVEIFENPDFREGLSASIRAGIGALTSGFDGVAFLLGDMPCVRSSHIDTLIGAFATAGRGAICVSSYQGSRGNPVLWDAQYLPDLRRLSGDVGGRGLLARYADRVREVPMPDGGVLIDVDRPDDFRSAASLPMNGIVDLPGRRDPAKLRSTTEQDGHG